MSWRKIDIHAHLFPPITQAQARALDPSLAPWLRIDSHDQGMIMRGDQAFRPVHAALWNTQVCVEHLDRHAVDLQIVSATPILFNYDLDAHQVADWATRMNDLALEFCAPYPKRLKSLAQVPLQHTELACRIALEAKRSGHIGVQIGNHVGDRDLDDAQLVEFLHHCACNDIPVLVHPWDMMGAGRMKRWMLPWLVAMPAETSLGILSLILSGAFERLPSNLKLCFAHGGGAFAFTLGRVDNAWRQRDIVRQDCPQLPSSYTKRFFVDSIVFDDKALRLLVDVMGSDRVMLGSDQPFPLGEQAIGNLVTQTPLLSPAEKRAILADNACRFFCLASDT